jgi:hypothetical protein
MLMAPAMFVPCFNDAGRKASCHAKCNESEEEGNPEFSHERLQAMLVSQENSAIARSIPARTGAPRWWRENGPIFRIVTHTFRLNLATF